MNEKRFKIGQIALVIYPWLQSELPGPENFHEGRILEIIERNPNCFYARIEGKTALIPFDRIVPVKLRQTKNITLRIRRKSEKFQLKTRRKNYVKNSKTSIRK